jgi:hypothetical protein
MRYVQYLAHQGDDLLCTNHALSFGEHIYPTFPLFSTPIMYLRLQVVGDDLLCTNPKRVQKAIDGKNCNALLLKVGKELQCAAA